MKEDHRVTFELLDDEIVMICRSAKRRDEGIYSVNLVNSMGADSADIKVVIVDKPGTPEGPLVVSSITSDSCKLSWNPPEVCVFFAAYILC